MSNGTVWAGEAQGERSGVLPWNPRRQPVLCSREIELLVQEAEDGALVDLYIPRRGEWLTG